jgi:hypothetical protein
MQTITLNTVYDLIAMNGTLIWNDNKQNGTEAKPGVITLEGRDNGLSIK